MGPRLSDSTSIRMMKYLLIALAVTAISAEVFDATKPDVDEFLEIEMTLPCTPKTCMPVCKLVTKYVSYGAYKLPYSENVCEPDTKCLAEKAACIAKLEAAMKAAEAAEKDMIAKAKKAQKDAAAAAKKKEEAAAADALAAAKAAFEAAEKEAAAANAAKVSSASTAKDKNAEMAKALAKYEAMKKLHLEAQAAYAGAKSDAATAAANYNAAVKAHCDTEAVHAEAVEYIGHGQFKKDECKKHEAAASPPGFETWPEPKPGKGAGSGCGMYDKHNNGGKISGTSCGSGYHGCNLKKGGKTGSKGGCCAGSGFHKRCHCSKTVDCKAMCNKDSGCLGWVNANHGCQWATISDAC